MSILRSGCRAIISRVYPLNAFEQKSDDFEISKSS